MKNLVDIAFERVRESLFFIPGFAIVLSFVVAFVTVSIDGIVAQGDGLPILLSVTPAAGRTILGSIAGATMTVTGIVFAMTAVTVQLASTAYSPRVIRGFLRDRFQQAVIAIAAATFAYSLLVMGTLGIDNPDEVETLSRPSASVTVGIVLGVLTLAAIVGFIDHIVREMRSDQVIGRVTVSTLRAIRRVHPEDAEQEPMAEQPLPEGGSVPVTAWRTGWVRGIDRDRILGALPAGAVLRLDAYVGTYMRSSFRIGDLWADGDIDIDAVTGDLREAVSVGEIRSVDRDPMFGLRLLVDIALRALSPGINDPTTAVAVIQHLGLPLMELLVRDLPPTVIRGDGGRRVFIPHAPERSDFIRVAFREIRLASGRQPEVLEAMIEVIGDLVAELDRRDHEPRTAALRAEAEEIVAVARELPVADRRRLTDAAERRRLLPTE